MNEWIKKSIEIANKPSYLDGISQIYEMQINPKRPLPTEIIPLIKEAFDKKESKKLIELLIQYSEIFPVKDSYIGFIKKKSEALEENPITTERIAERLYSLGYEKMIEESTRPKETNRQLGNAFRGWSQTKLGFKVVDEAEFLSNDEDILILKGSDKALSKFAKEVLGCKLKKGIDIIIKVKGKYIVGEAKFLTTPEGEQDRGFDDAEGFINEKSGDAIRIAILDGYIWLKSNSGLYNKIIESDDNIMSGLLLKDFIESL